MNRLIIRNGITISEMGRGRRALVRPPVATTFESREGIGGKRAVMAAMTLLVGLLIMVAETYFDNLRGNSVPSATFGTRGSAD